MTNTHEGRVWFTTGQAAEYSGFCTRTVSEALRSGRLRGQQINQRGRWRIHRSWLDRWLSGGDPGSVPNGAPSDAAVQAAAEVLAHGEAAAAQMSPREQAEAAYESDDIATVDQLEQQIRALRAQAARRRSR